MRFLFSKWSFYFFGTYIFLDPYFFCFRYFFNFFNFSFVLDNFFILFSSASINQFFIWVFHLNISLNNFLILSLLFWFFYNLFIKNHKSMFLKCFFEMTIFLYPLTKKWTSKSFFIYFYHNSFSIFFHNFFFINFSSINLFFSQHFSK